MVSSSDRSASSAWTCAWSTRNFPLCLSWTCTCCWWIIFLSISTACSASSCFSLASEFATCRVTEEAETLTPSSLLSPAFDALLSLGDLLGDASRGDLLSLSVPAPVSLTVPSLSSSSAFSAVSGSLSLPLEVPFLCFSRSLSSWAGRLALLTFSPPGDVPSLSSKDSSSSSSSSVNDSFSCRLWPSSSCWWSCSIFCVSCCS
mmetsp:Transcript_19864/g.76119  ORF Transcript_19864/g.76119 Transcript_19864/m.76119 type:complete len:203 (-) Transcript_19864:1392-2000(-)